jgi:hypothetical protein
MYIFNIRTNILFGWLFSFTSHSRIFHLYGDVTITDNTGVSSLVYMQLSANFMVVTTILFAHTTSLWDTCCMICNKPFLTHWAWHGSYRLPNLKIRLTAGLTDWKVMLTPPWHLIPPLVISGIHVSLICIVDCSIYLIWTLILTADFSFSWLDTLILTADCSVCQIWTYWFWHWLLKWGSQLVWPVDRRCLLLLFTWSTSDIFRGPCLPILWVVFRTGLTRMITVRCLCHFNQ